jgi:uncharacterized protein YcbK (DUF882 family)
MTAHFSIAELTDTNVRDVDNTCPDELMGNLKDLADMLERIRAALSAKAGFDVSVIVSSGYRSPEVNARVGGRPSSDHLQALAADIKAPSFGTPAQVSQFLAEHMADLGIGQIIKEFANNGGGWTHVSAKKPEREVNCVLTIDQRGVQVGIC